VSRFPHIAGKFAAGTASNTVSFFAKASFHPPEVRLCRPICDPPVDRSGRSGGGSPRSSDEQKP